MVRMDSAVDIVIIDDDSTLIALANRALSTSAHTHRCFSIPDEAIQYLSTITPKLLLIDYLMPMTDGLTLLKSIDFNQNRKNPQIYICSSIELPKAIHQAALNYGATPLLKGTMMKQGYIDQLCTKCG